MRSLVSLALTVLVLVMLSCSTPSTTTRSDTVSGAGVDTQPRAEQSPAPFDPTKIYGYAERDPTLPHLRGSGWYCYDATVNEEVYSYCYRKKHCDSARDEADSIDGVTATACSPHEGKAACLLATHVSRSEQLWSCKRTMAACERDRMGSLAARDRYLFVSRCETID